MAQHQAANSLFEALRHETVQHVQMWACCCLCAFLSIRGRKPATAAACLFSSAIFSYWPCQGPHNHPPTVGSSGLQYNGLQQTPVIHLCHVFIHPVKHTCSPLMPPAAFNMSKIHTSQWTWTCFGVWSCKRRLKDLMSPRGSSAWVQTL